MTSLIHTMRPSTALNFERAQVGGTITKVVGATSVEGSCCSPTLRGALK